MIIWVKFVTNKRTTFVESLAVLGSPNTTPLPTTTSNATAAIENEVNEKDNDTDNVPMIAGIFSGALIIIIIILVSVGTVIYRRKIRDVEWRTRVEMANFERRVPGEHYEYNPEGVYYGDDKSTYYTDYVTDNSMRTRSAGSESSEEEGEGYYSY